VEGGGDLHFWEAKSNHERRRRKLAIGEESRSEEAQPPERILISGVGNKEKKQWCQTREGRKEQ